MADRIKTGDEVELTIRGKLGTFDGSAFCGHVITSDSGVRHTVYLGGRTEVISDGQTRYGVTVEKITPPFVTGQAYIDADDEVFIRFDGGWIDFRHNEWTDADKYPDLPLRKMIPEA